VMMTLRCMMMRMTSGIITQTKRKMLTNKKSGLHPDFLYK
jgi:hypothetical protein